MGGIYLRDLIAWYPSDMVACGVIGPLAGAAANKECLPQLEKLVVPVDAPRYIGREGSVRARVSRMLAWRRARFQGTQRAVTAVVAHARLFRPDRLVAVLEHPLMYDIALRVARALGVATTVIVQDPPEYLLRATGTDRWSARQLMCALDELMARSCRIGAASPRMAATFQRRYGVPALWLVHGFERAQWKKPLGALHGDGVLTMVFAGSLYATDAWHAFLATLRECSWAVGGRRVRLRLIGGASAGPITNGAHYELYAWRSQAETIELLHTSDIAYLPYWLDPRHSDVTSLSFPSKLSAYLAAGVPVLFHGPRTACVAEFIRDMGCGKICDSADPADLVATIEDLISPAAYMGCSARIPQVCEEYLGAHVFRRRFAELVDADERAFEKPPEPLCTCGYS